MFTGSKTALLTDLFLTAGFGPEFQQASDYLRNDKDMTKIDEEDRRDEKKTQCVSDQAGHLLALLTLVPFLRIVQYNRPTVGEGEIRRRVSMK